MNGKRIVAYCSGSVILAIAFFAYMEFIYMLGFPDGFVSELQLIQRNFAYVLIGVSVGFSFYFFWLGAIASRRQISKPLLDAIVLYLLFIISIALIYDHYRLR
ncbi:hypothetical protein H6F67_10695 [Microcoleus sp. FACHB-1515]|uniref:hypothetical protein n=1 Tax=Cyanophyceae TaxID=3028117 RepID=UPI001682BED4|nr:hypothetical protein [Microcoleus sp. FACHB-1515]MBD2090321.1 hypothetical protein [Microcoleus sp. FACHB-1515]